jgi:hypothetical protein
MSVGEQTNKLNDEIIILYLVSLLLRKSRECAFVKETSCSLIKGSLSIRSWRLLRYGVIFLLFCFFLFFNLYNSSDMLSTIVSGVTDVITCGLSPYGLPA